MDAPFPGALCRAGDGVSDSYGWNSPMSSCLGWEDEWHTESRVYTAFLTGHSIFTYILLRFF